MCSSNSKVNTDNPVTKYYIILNIKVQSPTIVSSLKRGYLTFMKGQGQVDGFSGGGCGEWGESGS